MRSVSYCDHGVSFLIPHLALLFHLYSAHRTEYAVLCFHRELVCGGALEIPPKLARSQWLSQFLNETGPVVKRRASDLVRLLHGALGAGAGGPMAYLGQSQTEQSLVTIGSLMEKVR